MEPSISKIEVAQKMMKKKNVLRLLMKIKMAFDIEN